MKIIFCAMTLQTANHLPQSKEVFGIPMITNKGNWYMEQYIKTVCTKTNSFHNEGEIYLSKSSYRIDKNTLKVSVDNGNFEDFEFENYVI